MSAVNHVGDVGDPATGQDAALLYDAFISYSRRDKAFASALEQALERYTPPVGLGLPQRRLAVFRDVEDLVGTEYRSAIEKALGASAKLIVLCSPVDRLIGAQRSPNRCLY